LKLSTALDCFCVAALIGSDRKRIEHVAQRIHDRDAVRVSVCINPGEKLHAFLKFRSGEVVGNTLVSEEHSAY
jgi:hypothetical protein